MAREVKVYTIDDHIEKASEETRRLFESLRESILNIGSEVKEVPKKKYIAYKTTSNFADVVILKDSLKLFINVPSGKLNDPARIARDLETPKHIGHWGNGDYEVIIKEGDKLPYIATLIEQSYRTSK